MDTLLEQATPPERPKWPKDLPGITDLRTIGALMAEENYAYLLGRYEAVNAYEPLVKALRELVEKGDILNRYVSDMRLEEHTMLSPSIRAAQSDYVAARRAALATVESSPEREGGE